MLRWVWAVRITSKELGERITDVLGPLNDPKTVPTLGLWGDPQADKEYQKHISVSRCSSRSDDCYLTMINSSEKHSLLLSKYGLSKPESQPLST